MFRVSSAPDLNTSDAEDRYILADYSAWFPLGFWWSLSFWYVAIDRVIGLETALYDFIEDVIFSHLAGRMPGYHQGGPDRLGL
jgi:hypothetical protein